MLGFALNVGTGVAFVCVLMMAAPTNASVLIALDLEELTAEADRIVLGQVVWSEPVRRANGMIRTRYRIQVDQDLRGSGDSEIVVETLGGRIGRLGLRVEGAASFALHQKVVVFVQNDGGTVFRPVGMAQGVMHVEHQNGRDMVVPSRRGMLLVRPGARGVLVKSAGPLPGPERLDAFLSRVREIIDAQRGVTR